MKFEIMITCIVLISKIVSLFIERKSNKKELTVINIKTIEGEKFGLFAFSEERKEIELPEENLFKRIVMNKHFVGGISSVYCVTIKVKNRYCAIII